MWTPASRPGIIPLHPLGFGTILGRAFSALRHNPAVLLGVALGVQFVGYFVMLLGTLGVAFLTYQRLETLAFGSDDWMTIFVGSTVVTIVTGLILGILAGTLQVLVQGVVVSEVASAALAEKHSLRALWVRVRPVAWRLIGYTAMLVAAVLILLVIVVVLLFLLATVTPPIAITLGVLVVLGSIPLSLWLSTKLLLVTSVLVMEHTTIRGAIVRSWQLTRGRFWPILGIVVVISLIMGTITQFVGLPFSLLSTGLGTVIAPTGDPSASAIIGVLLTSLLAQVVTLLVSCITVVVSSTAAAIIYIDCRMRAEGLDIDLLGYIERRDAGEDVSYDPYAPHPERPHAVRAAYVDPWLLPAGSTPAFGYPGAPQAVAPSYPVQGYPAPGYAPYPAQGAPAQGYPAPAQAAYPAYPTQPGAPVQGGYPAQPAYPAAPAQPAYPAQPPAWAGQNPAAAAPAQAPETPTAWVAPGQAAARPGRPGSDEATPPADPDSPWA